MDIVFASNFFTGAGRQNDDIFLLSRIRFVDLDSIRHQSNVQRMFPHKFECIDNNIIINFHIPLSSFVCDDCMLCF